MSANDSPSIKGTAFSCISNGNTDEARHLWYYIVPFNYMEISIALRNVSGFRLLRCTYVEKFFDRWVQVFTSRRPKRWRTIRGIWGSGHQLATATVKVREIRKSVVQNGAVALRGIHGMPSKMLLRLGNTKMTCA